jgi:hypothetical protein
MYIDMILVFSVLLMFGCPNKAVEETGFPPLRFVSFKRVPVQYNFLMLTDSPLEFTKIPLYLAGGGIVEATC